MNISNNKRYIETEARIHLAFEKLLSVKSFNEITVNNICNEAGISRPSFYAHYEDINDMMNQIELEKSLPIKQMLISADRLTVDSFESYFNYLQNNKSFYVAYLGISTNGTITTDLMNTFIHTVNIAKSEYIQSLTPISNGGLILAPPGHFSGSANGRGFAVPSVLSASYEGISTSFRPLAYHSLLVPLYIE